MRGTTLAKNRIPQMTCVTALEQARMHLNNGEPAKAIAPAMQALWDAEHAHAPHAECDARAIFARALGQSGDHLSAMVQFQRAFITAKELRDVRLQSVILDGLGHSFLALEGYADALRAFRGAIAASDVVGNRELKAITCAELIRTLCRTGEAEGTAGRRTAANRYFRRALEVSNRYQHEIDAAGTPQAARVFFRVNRAYALIQNRQFDEAQEILVVAARSAIVRQRGRHWAATSALRAHLALMQGQWADAAQMLHLLTDELERAGQKDILLRVRTSYVMALEKLQKFPEALAEQRKQIAQLRALGRDILANRDRIARLQSELERQRTQAQQLQRVASHWEARAHVDALTGLNSRRKLEELFAQPQANRDRARTVLMIDLDHFKGINDRYGHAVGDRVLLAAATVLKNCIKSLGLETTVAAYRYGGEEFAVIGGRLSNRQGIEVAEISRLKIKQYRWQRIAKGLSVTASVGLAQGALTMPRALQLADAALYKAKRSGRDQVVVA
jgi:diguanylate cyclase (GGDEF)-like protein